MARYVIHKTSRAATDQSYIGNSWHEAGLSDCYKPVYTGRYEAEELARELSRFNPVGFTVSKIEDEDV